MYLFCFAAGVGIQPISHFQLYGNFTVIDFVILLYTPIYLLQRRTIIVPENGRKIIIVIFLLALWQMFSLLFSPYEMKMVNFGPNVRLLYYGLVFLLFLGKIDDEIHLLRISQYFIFGLIVNLIHCFYLWSLEPNYFWGLPILNNSYVSRNPLYYFIVFGLPMVISFAKLSNNLKLSYFYYFFAGILATIAFITFSKGAWLILIVICGMFAIMYSKKAIVPFILFLGLIILFFNFGSLNIETIFSAINHRIYGSTSTVLTRYEFITTGIQMGLDHFLFGVGLRSSDPHNVYVMIFAETGIIGLLLYIFIIIFIIHDLRKAFKFIHQRKENYSLMVYWKTAFMLLTIILLLNVLTGMAFNAKFFCFFLIYIEGLLSIVKIKNRGYLISKGFNFPKPV